MIEEKDKWWVEELDDDLAISKAIREELWELNIEEIYYEPIWSNIWKSKNASKITLTNNQFSTIAENIITDPKNQYWCNKECG